MNGSQAPAMLIVAGFSRYQEALAWLQETIENHWGSIALKSPVFEFNDTGYYRDQMGDALIKQFYAVQPGEVQPGGATTDPSRFAERPWRGPVFDPGRLADCKRQSVRWEVEYANLRAHPELRPLNIDPGYVVPTKLVLASTKDRAHRIYLDHGIHAEIALRYLHDWQVLPWTYPDYQRPETRAFFHRVREFLLHSAKSP